MGKQMMIRLVLGAGLILGLTMPVGLATAAARDYSDACHQRLESARTKIDQDAARYGQNSDRVAHDRVNMDKARQWCRDHKADWDHTRFDVGIYIK